MGRTLKKPQRSTPDLHGSGKTILRPSGKGKSIPSNMQSSGGKTPSMVPRPQADASSSSLDSSSSSDLSEVHPPTPVKKRTKTKSAPRKSAISAIKRTRLLVEKQAALPRNGTAASKRRGMVSVSTTTRHLGEHLQSPLVQAYTALEVNNMRKIERQKYGRVDPYAFVKTSFTSLINHVVREALLENGEIDDDTEVVVTIPNLTMTFLKCINTRRLSNVITGVTTICESANRKRITPQYLMTYNRIAQPIDGAVRGLPMSTGGAPIDLTSVNDAANEAEKSLRAGSASTGVASTKPRAPRKKLTPEQREAAAKLTAERKRRREEAAAKKKEEAEAKKQKKAEEVAERKRKKEEEAAERKKKREEAAAEKKKKREEAAAEKKRNQEEVAAEKKRKLEEAVAEKAAIEKKQKEEESIAKKTRKREKATDEKKRPTLTSDDVVDSSEKNVKKRAREEDDVKPSSPVKKSKIVEEPTGGGDHVRDILASLLGGAGKESEEDDFDYDF